MAYHRCASERSLTKEAMATSLRSRRIATLALITFAMLLALLLVLHWLRRDSNPIEHRLSEYVMGPYGYLMTAIFVIATLGVFILAGALVSAAGRSRWVQLACLGLVGAGASNALMAIFAAEPWMAGQPTETVIGSAGWFHDRFAMLHAFCWSGVVVATPLGLRGNPSWRRFAMWSALAGLVVALAMTVRAVTPMSVIGLTQRAWIAAVLIWGVTHALAIRKHAP